MMLIADSGATKTDWALIHADGTAQYLTTQGLSPVHASESQLSTVIAEELLPQLSATSPATIHRIHFYGAGCSGHYADDMHALLQRNFPGASIEVNSDLLGAAHALCGEDSGLVCILGTGSNSCLYDGQRIVCRIPPLGYILGDEGSGAVLGRMLLNRLLKDPSCVQLRDKLFQAYSLTYEDIIDRVYCQPQANRFLASLVPFVLENIGEPAILQLVLDNFRQFFRNNLCHYAATHQDIYAVGGVAHVFRSQLERVCEEFGMRLCRVLPRPIEGLVECGRWNVVV